MSLISISTGGFGRASENLYDFVRQRLLGEGTAITSWCLVCESRSISCVRFTPDFAVDLEWCNKKMVIRYEVLVLMKSILNEE